MVIVRFLSSLTLRSVLGGVCEAAGLDRDRASPELMAFALTVRFRDHSHRVGTALQQSVERGWSAVEIALAGDSWWQRVKGLLGQREDQVFAQQIRQFVEVSELPELAGKTKFREACLSELKSARRQGLLTQAPDGDPLGRYVDPASLLDSEAQVIENVVAVLQEAGLGNLAYLLSIQSRQGQPLLVIAVRYFFRRAIEEDPKLFQGLTYTQLDQLKQGQTEAFACLHDVLAQNRDRLEELLGDLKQQVAQTHEAVLDVQAELTRQGSQNGDIYQAVLDLQKRLDLMHREIRPRDSLSIRTDQERVLVREVIARYRALPEASRQKMPALLNAVGKLEVAAGYFEAAQEDFGHVANIVQDGQAKGEAHINAYRTALERRDWDSAIRELHAAIRIDSNRYAPFPVGKYQPVRILGAGGFGVAFLCRHEQLDADVVVKTLVSEDLDRDVDQVFTEAKALYKLEHRAIIRLLDCGYTRPETKSRPYFVMNYFEGTTLEEHIQRHGPLTVDDMAEVAWQMAEGLRAAHSRGILHRDVKPANVLVRHDPGEPGVSTPGAWSVKLIDFGLALSQKAITEAATQRQTQSIVASSIAGTMEYAAPEQMGKLPGVKVAAPADVYGLAKTCCYALFETTEPTFHEWKRLPGGWPELLADCLQRNPEKRPQSMAAFVERLRDLRGAADGESVDLAIELDTTKPRIPEPMRKLIGDHGSGAKLKQVRGKLDDIETMLMNRLKETLGKVTAGAIYVQPDIAAKKVANARIGCLVPDREKVLALVDCTTFGSASDAIVFGLEGIYYHNMGGNVPDPGFVPYSEFGDINFTSAWLNCVTLGKTVAGVERYCNKAGANISCDELIELFGHIKDDMTGRNGPTVLPRMGGLVGRVSEILKAQRDLIEATAHGYYVSPNIPPRKVNGATKGCALPPDERILGLIDCTVFGSAVDALVFGQRGFYYHNVGGNVPDPGVVLYEEFPHLKFRTSWLNCVTLGGDRYCNKSGSTIPRDRLIAILDEIKKAVVEVQVSGDC